MRTDDRRPAMIDDVLKIFRQQPIIDRDQHRADLRYSVERFQMRMRVWCDINDPITRSDTDALKRRRPTVTAVEKLGISKPLVAIDNGFTVGIKPARAPGKIHRSQRCFHNAKHLYNLMITVIDQPN